ncbi:glycerate kinase [Filibacter tadaridae]|uniref:Glycerate kinase n=1 Tax=Filibacter tadaridae TaxID=2483811 RepID=A0A3P5WQ61_9BACL|nr:glycerate kinase [Filibacter tadaridae]VDC21671.1 Glycerate kinase [Filibacter tadaridae]
MKVILAPDSFKGSLTALEAAKAMATGIHEFDSFIHTVLLPVADGGEGTMKSLVDATNGKIVYVDVQDPLGRPIKAGYGVLGDGETCIIEFAEASGLMLLTASERNPMEASSFGTGEVIKHALNDRYRKFIIGLGGSATNDGGAGMLQALGMRFLDIAGMELPIGGEGLFNLQRIDNSNFDKRIASSEFILACDVKNPFVGSTGASAVFGPQKGASSEMVKLLDRSLTQFADIVEKLTGISLHSKKGAGAAGGAGGAFQAFFGCTMSQGIDVVLNAISFDAHVKSANLILTGEGKTDVQTLSGKTPFGVAKVAHRESIPIILISGAVDEECRESLMSMFDEIHALTDDSVSSEEAIEHAFHLLQKKTKVVFEDYIKNRIGV